MTSTEAGSAAAVVAYATSGSHSALAVQGNQMKLDISIAK